MLLTLLASIGKFLSGLMDWLVGERLRRLGRLEATNEALTRQAADQAVADRIDAAPPVTDGDELLERLRQPSAPKADVD